MQQTTAHMNELQRRPAPAARIQPIALYNGTLWAGSWETKHVYAIDPKNWKVLEDFAAPGTPYGIAPLDNALHVVVSDDGEADDRYFYRLIPGKGFDAGSKAPCPQLTGSHLASDGRKLWLGQMHERRIVTLDERYEITAKYPLQSRCAGFGFGPNGTLAMISADEEFEELVFGTFDVAKRPPEFEPQARFGFGARSLAYDGSAWFTSDREVGDIVSFSVA